MGTFPVYVHHGGYFKKGKKTEYCKGMMTILDFNDDYWGYYTFKRMVFKKLHYLDIYSVLYKIGGKGLDIGMKELVDDNGAAEMKRVASVFGGVHAYIVHNISDPVVVQKPLLLEAPNVEEEESANVNHETMEEEDPNVVSQPVDEEIHIEDDSFRAMMDEIIDALNEDEVIFEGESGLGEGVAVEGEGGQGEDVAVEGAEDEGEEEDDDVASIQFGDSDEEHPDVDLFGNVNNDPGVQTEEAEPTEAQPEEGEPPEAQPEEEPEPTKKRRRRGRARKVTAPLVEEPVDPYEPVDGESSDDNIVGDGSRATRTRGLSDEEYESDELVSGSEDDEGGPRRVPIFQLPKRMSDYKWAIGTYFETKEDFKNAIATYAVHSGRNIKFQKNDKIRVRVICKKGCPWMALCTKLPDEDTWQLRKLVDNHTCSRDYKVSMLSSKWLSKKVQSNLRDNPGIRLTTIQNRVQEKWNMGVTKSKAYRAKKKARGEVDGSYREQYRRLQDYCHELLASNPGSTVRLRCKTPDGDEGDLENPDAVMLPTFERLYVAYDACIKSFKLCRPVIHLDGCFLKGPYGGQLLSAVGRDPNDQMLPIAVAVVEGENRGSWEWFLGLLIEDLGGANVVKTNTFVSDQQKGLIPALKDLLPGVEHRYCVRHLYANFRKKFPGVQLKQILRLHL